MINTDLVSIILPVYNGKEYINDSIESCLNQTYPNIELIIVDDCSTDGTYEQIMTNYGSDSRVRVFRNNMNSKLPKSLNNGFSYSKGKYLTWTSHDNFYSLNAIDLMVKELKRTGASFVYASQNIINFEGENIGLFKAKKITSIYRGNPVNACFLYTRDVYTEIGDYDENLFLIEDYDYWIRIYNKFKVTFLPNSLYSYRVHDNSLSRKRFDDSLLAFYNLVLKYEKDRDTNFFDLPIVAFINFVKSVKAKRLRTAVFYFFRIFTCKI